MQESLEKVTYLISILPAWQVFGEFCCDANKTRKKVILCDLLWKWEFLELANGLLDLI